MDTGYLPEELLYFLDDFTNGTFLEVYLGLVILTYISSFVAYVFSSLALYRMGTKLGRGSRWMAWVPIANIYYIGCLCDYIPVGSKKFSGSMPVSLLVATIGGEILTMVLLFLGTSSQSLFLLIPAVILSFLMIGFAVAYAVFIYAAYYRLFNLFTPDKALLFFLLSLFLGVLPYFLFAASFYAPAESAACIKPFTGLVKSPKDNRVLSSSDQQDINPFKRAAPQASAPNAHPPQANAAPCPPDADPQLQEYCRQNGIQPNSPEYWMLIESRKNKPRG